MLLHGSVNAPVPSVSSPTSNCSLASGPVCTEVIGAGRCLASLVVKYAEDHPRAEGVLEKMSGCSVMGPSGLEAGQGEMRD